MEQPHSALAIAACVVLVHSGASLVFAFYNFSVLQVALCLPFVVLASAVAARAIRGDPATLGGIRVGLQDRKLFHHAVDALEGKKDRPQYALIAMPINHFGERVRWVLDLIGADYEEFTVGGLISAFLRGRSVPHLIDRKSCSMIGNSDECIAYLSAVYVPTIQDSQLREKAASFLASNEQTRIWNKKLNQLGHLVQGWCYFYILAGDMDTEGCLTAWGAFEPKVPLVHRLVLRLFGPVFKSMMRLAFDLSSVEVRDKRREMIEQVLDDIDKTLSKQKYLTGASLSHVDITLSALLAPMLAAHLAWAPKSRYANGRFTSFHGAFDRMRGKWPRALSEFEQALVKRPCAKFVMTLYEEMRSKKLQ
ncbi:unnamed protein product [Cladocopium goreaui]|uniref:Glutathione S-transferase C-terminal domain-containing protein n=1 Tax=Cladocopium goreaui TaxID=2562237 RepID=A0A9P1DB22_9DINO|nr:unnamed protein product [Cladocopium goreaui]